MHDRSQIDRALTGIEEERERNAAVCNLFILSHILTISNVIENCSNLHFVFTWHLISVAEQKRKKEKERRQ